MTQRIIRSYPVRLVFVVGAVVAAVLIIHYRLLVKRDFNLVRANRQPISS